MALAVTAAAMATAGPADRPITTTTPRVTAMSPTTPSGSAITMAEVTTITIGTMAATTGTGRGSTATTTGSVTTTTAGITKTWPPAEIAAATARGSRTNPRVLLGGQT